MFCIAASRGDEVLGEGDVVGVEERDAEVAEGDGGARRGPPAAFLARQHHVQPQPRHGRLLCLLPRGLRSN